MQKFTEIGIVKSKYKEPADPVEMRNAESIIKIKPEFTDGLYKIESNEYLDVIFNFHKSENYQLQLTNRFGEFKGVFATRAPRRPSNIGLTRVKLIKLENNILHVKGLDAIDETPVIDIKPVDNGFLSEEYEKVQISGFKKNPRGKIMSLVKGNKIEELLAMSGMLHGHYCPGVAMGVLGSVYALNKLKEHSDGMENLLAIVEINSCFVDGIQFVTGCSLGNNSLIVRDFGISAFSLVKRNGCGLRLSSRKDFGETLRNRNTEFTKYYQLVVAEKNRDEKLMMKYKQAAKQACFNIAKWTAEDAFHIEEVKLDIPDYAPVKSSVICNKCGESIMSGKEAVIDNKINCKMCGNAPYFQLDGSGISKIQS